MKKNTFYLVVDSVELHIRFLVEAAFIIAITIIYLIRKRVTDIIEDERTAKITEQASLRTFQVRSCTSPRSRRMQW